MKKALSYLLIFIGLQIVGGGIVTTLWNMIAGNSDETAAKLITTTAVVGIITIVIFLWTRYAEVSPKDEHNKPIPGTEERYTCDTLLLSCGLIPENELSNKAGITINPVTNGPVVNESLETSVPGIFACGNVLHVHDLVDFVSEEAQRAGEAAARFVQSEGQEERSEKVIKLIATDGVRYTVPSTIDLANMDEMQPVLFRVGAVYKDSYVSVYYNDERMIHMKKKIMAPGEMERINLRRDRLALENDLETITIKIEAE